MYPTCKTEKKKKKKVSLRSCCWCKIGVAWSICPNQQQRPLLKNSYIPIVSVITLYYDRLYQILNLEVDLSSEGMKQLCRQKPPSQVYIGTPKLITKPDLF